MSAANDERKEAMSLDDTIADKILQLVSSDGEKFPVSSKIACQSELVKTMSQGDADETDIPLPNVKAAILRKVVAYMSYHADNPAKDIEKPLKSANMTEIVSQWDAGQLTKPH